MNTPQDNVLILLGELKGKIDSVIANMSIHVNAHSKRLDEHDDRINKLEMSKAWAVGYAAAVSAVIALLSKVIH